jgi:predicted permease
MSRPGEWFRRLGYLLTRRRVDEVLRQEMEAHREMLDEPARFGNARRLREDAHDAWGWRWLDDLSRDVRFALRTLRRSPGFTIAAVSTLALAIGANLAIFTLIDRVVLHPLAVPDPAHLVTFQRTIQLRAGPRLQLWMTWEDAKDLRTLRTPVSLALSSTSNDRTSRAIALDTGSGDTLSVPGRFVSGNFFRVLGLRPALGRDFVDADDQLTASAVAILSDRGWRTRFAADASIVGRTIHVNNVLVLIVGVLPATFAGIDLGAPPPEIYLPLMTASRLADNGGEQTDGRGHMWTSSGPSRGPAAASPISPVVTVMGIARVTAGTTARLQAELSTHGPFANWTVVRVADTMLPFGSWPEIRQFVGLLAAAVTLTLLIGCANLAGLLLARAEARRTDLAVRSALGASRMRLARQLAVEAGLLAIVGGAAAWLLNRGLGRMLAPFVLPGGIPISALPATSLSRLFGMTLGLVVLVAAIIAIAPATLAMSRRLSLDLKRRGGGSSRLGLARGLVGVQVAIGVVLTFSASLFIQSLSNALATDVGFQRDGLVSATLAMPRANQMFGSEALDALAAKIRELPDVSAASVGPLPLVQGSDFTYTDLLADGARVDSAAPIDVVYAAADYFTTLGQPLVRGRDFDDRDRANGRLVMIVNDAAARLLWSTGADPLEHHVTISSAGRSTDYAVVGVTQDVRLKTLRDANRPVLYLCRPQHAIYLSGFMAGAGHASLIVRTSRDSNAIAGNLRATAAAEGFSLTDVTTISQAIDTLVMPQRLGRALLTLLGVTAIVLTVVGMYGLVAAVVARQKKEIGIRMALGAKPHAIVRSVLTKTSAPLLTGIAAGAAFGWWGGHLADRFMYGIRGANPVTMTIAIALVTGAGLAAAWLPTRRALRINPIDTLRVD